jgi:hypothetical protein
MGPFRELGVAIVRRAFCRELARNYELNAQDLRRVEQLIEEREQEIRDAWRRHFRS